VDGDTSTNDTVILPRERLYPECAPIQKRWARFEDGVTIVMETLARQIARDGEGAKKQSPSMSPARLMKTTRTHCAGDREFAASKKRAIAGSDPNWVTNPFGCRKCRRGIRSGESRYRNASVVVCRGGLAARFSESELKKKLDDPECSIRFNIAEKGRKVALLDLRPHGRLHSINASYRHLRSPAAAG
jgi:glutamate N-acetyltransferase/amino-acid N-acetyltransferase